MTPSSAPPPSPFSLTHSFRSSLSPFSPPPPSTSPNAKLTRCPLALLRLDPFTSTPLTIGDRGAGADTGVGDRGGVGSVTWAGGGGGGGKGEEEEVVEVEVGGGGERRGGRRDARVVSNEGSTVVLMLYS